MLNFTFQQIFFRLVALLIIAAVHGFAVSAAARLLGDKGPAYDGRLTLNPFRHLDLVGGAGVVLFSLGWIRPTAIEATELRIGRLGLAIIVLCGALATLASALFLLWVVRPLVATSLSDTTAQNLTALINTTADLGVWFAIFNVLPIPPLTGAHLLSAIFPVRQADVRRYELATTIILGTLIVTGLAERMLSPAYKIVAARIF